MSGRRTWLGLGAAALIFGAAIAPAAPLERDLGQGLSYLRLRALPDDLPGTATARPAPCVVDVRFVAADAGAAETFMTWLRGRAASRPPAIVLANAATSPDLRRVLARSERHRGILVVGVPSRDFTPDVEARSSTEAERSAYDALERGVELAKLLTDNPGKVRNDEASLSRDRLAEAAAEAAEDALSGAPAQPPPAVDAALQRAVHLHRALVALKKI